MTLGGDEDFAAWQKRVQGTNISAQSLLATDYLNHFSEIVMLLELVADMPDCIDELRAWHPRDYCEHFRDSAFPDRALAIEAYAHVPPRFKMPFEETLTHLHALVAMTVARLDEAAAAGTPLNEIARTASHRLQRLMDHASAVIHGSERGLDQAEIDALLGAAC